MDEETEKILEEAETVKIEPLEVKVVNQKEDKVSEYDSKDDWEYEDLGITKEELEEFENGDTSG